MNTIPKTTEFKREATGWGTFPFTDEDFRRIAGILHESAGIHLPASKSSLVYSRLTRRLRALGLESFRDYCAFIVSERGIAERQTMIAALTTNVTSFFREPHHFTHLKKHVLERRLDEVRKGGRLRLWSAACSSGQEPYSIAMTILSLLPEALSLDVRVLATDIDFNMIANAKAGVYDRDAMQSVPSDLRDAYFRRSGEGADASWTVSEKLSSLVAFRELNLIGDWPMKGQFDAVLCRNVVIYFDEATQHKIWSRFLPFLKREGRLYIGHSERVSGPACESLIADGVTTYRLKGKDAR